VTTRTSSPACVSRPRRVANKPRTISPAISAALQISNGTTSAQKRTERNLPESQVRLQQALRTLRGIRQRHEIARSKHSEPRFLSVHIALDDADMRWIAAVISALEKAIVDVGISQEKL